MNAKQVVIGIASVAITAGSFGISYAAVDAARGGGEPTALLPSGEPLEVVSPAPDTSASGADDSGGGGSEPSTDGGSSGSGGGGAGAAPVEQRLEVVTASETPSEGPSATPSDTTATEGEGTTDGLPFGADVPVLRFIDACASGQRSACPESFVPGTILFADDDAPRPLGVARRLDEIAGPFDIYAAILEPVTGADRTFDLCRAAGVEAEHGSPVLAVYSSHPARFTVTGSELPPVTAVAAGGGSVTVVGAEAAASAWTREIPTFAFETQSAQARAWRDALATTGRPRWVVTCHRLDDATGELDSNDRVRLEGFATPLPEMGTGGDRFEVETTLRGSGLVPGLIVLPQAAAGEVLAQAPHRSDQFVHVHAFGIDEEQVEALRAVGADEAFCSDSLGDDPSYGGRALPVSARANSVNAVPAGTSSDVDPSYTRVASVRFEVPGDVARIAVCGYWVQRDDAALVDRALVVASTPRNIVRLKVDVDPSAERPEGSAPLRNLGLDFVAGPGSYWCRWDFRPTGPTRDICRESGFADQDVYEVVVNANGTRERQQVPAPACDGPRCRRTMLLLGDVAGEGTLVPVASISLEKTSGVAAGWGVYRTVRSRGGIEIDEELAPRLGEIPWTSSVNDDGTLRLRVPWSASRPARVEAFIDSTTPSCVMPAEARTSYLSIEPAREGVAVFDRLCVADVYGITWTLVGRNGARRTVEEAIDTT